jgi:hypothetical protein
MRVITKLAVVMVAAASQLAKAQTNGWIRDPGLVRLANPADRVGLGTPTPASKLHIFARTRVAEDGQLQITR